MQWSWLNKSKFLTLFIILMLGWVSISFAENANIKDARTIDRVQLANRQIDLLKDRLIQAKKNLSYLQEQHNKEILDPSLGKVNKNVLDKASLDITVAKSNLDSINIELADCQQMITWLEKSVQEIQNQLNVVNMFGVKASAAEFANAAALKADFSYQQKLLSLERERLTYLQDLQATVHSIYTIKKDSYARLESMVKSRKLLLVKQQQAKDELAFQEEQNTWLIRLNQLYGKIAQTDPVKSKDAYAELEREIFNANENASLAYAQSLIARYDDQVQQMKLTLMKSNSITLLNEMSEQVQVLNKQTSKLTGVMEARIQVLAKHIDYLQSKKSVSVINAHLQQLTQLQQDYKDAGEELNDVIKALAVFRVDLEAAMKEELSARQGFPSFEFKTFFDLGKEMLLIPGLTFNMLKSFYNGLQNALSKMTAMSWIVLGLLETLGAFVFFFLRTVFLQMLARPSVGRDKINSKLLCLEWFSYHLLDLFLIANAFALLMYLAMPVQNYMFLFYLAGVWLVFKTILLVAHICLIETTHDTSGHDVILYHRLKWLIFIGGFITALTVFVHQLPMVYELKMLFDRLFLLLSLMVSILLLRSWRVVPNLIMSQMEAEHPYLQKSICFMGILIPLLMLGNSLIGLFGYVNLIKTVSWYEGIFLIVLIGYLILRGLLSDSMEQLSRILIEYTNNGWLWTEAFLKPIDKVLRITLFLVAWAVLFLLYGWDKQSPIVERLTRLMHYELASVLNTTITPLSMIELVMVISIFYWTAKWIREFVYRMLLSRTQDMGIRNSIAIISQYTVVMLGAFFCLRVLGIDLRALAVVAGMFAFGVGLGLRDLANNFACGFLILLERPLRVGDIVEINGVEGEVTHIGGRAVTVRTWDYMELVVPNADVFNKSFTNWTAKDNIVRSIISIKISRYDDPHQVRSIIHDVLTQEKQILTDPNFEVFLKDMSDTLMEFQVRYFINIRQVKSRTYVASEVLMKIWDAFAANGIKPPFPQQEIFLRHDHGVVNIHPAP